MRAIRRHRRRDATGAVVRVGMASAGGGTVAQGRFGASSSRRAASSQRARGRRRAAGPAVAAGVRSSRPDGRRAGVVAGYACSTSGRQGVALQLPVTVGGASTPGSRCAAVLRAGRSRAGASRVRRRPRWRRVDAARAVGPCEDVVGRQSAGRLVRVGRSRSAGADRGAGRRASSRPRVGCGAAGARCGAPLPPDVRPTRRPIRTALDPPVRWRDASWLAAHGQPTEGLGVGCRARAGVAERVGVRRRCGSSWRLVRRRRDAHVALPDLARQPVAARERAGGVRVLRSRPARPPAELAGRGAARAADRGVAVCYDVRRAEEAAIADACAMPVAPCIPVVLVRGGRSGRHVRRLMGWVRVRRRIAGVRRHPDGGRRTRPDCLAGSAAPRGGSPSRPSRSTRTTRRRASIGSALVVAPPSLSRVVGVTGVGFAGDALDGAVRHAELVGDGARAERGAEESVEGVTVEHTPHPPRRVFAVWTRT